MACNASLMGVFKLVASHCALSYQNVVTDNANVEDKAERDFLVDWFFLYL